MSMLGHNRPPLADLHADLAQRAAAAVGDLSRATIDDDDDAAALAEAGKHARRIAEEIEAARKEAKEPHLQAGREIDAYFKSLATPLDAFVTECKRLIGGYQARREAAERARLAEEARLAREAAAAAIEAARSVEQFEEAVSAADAVDAAAAQVEAVKPADLARVTSGGYAVASVRETWTFEVVDAAAIPRDYLMLNEARVRAVIAGKHGLREIPGLRIYAKRTTVL